MYRVHRPLILLMTITGPEFAWHALGHNTVVAIAWRELSSGQRQTIVDTLPRHPRFAHDFTGNMADDVQTPNKTVQDRWILHHSGTWPDLIRGNRENDRPTWHYVNFPLFLDGNEF